MKDRFAFQMELVARATSYVETKIQETRKKRKQIIKQIIQEQTKNRTQLYFSIFALIALLPYVESPIQKKEIYRKLAEKIAQFEYDLDYEIWIFIIMRGQVQLMKSRYYKIIFAMCWIMKYHFGIYNKDELPALESHLRILQSEDLDFFFNRTFYMSLHPHKIA
jgi:hypothetical protein